MDTWLLLLLIALGISIISQILNKILRIDPQRNIGRQQRLLALSKRLQLAREEIMSGGSEGNIEYEQIKKEFVALLKEITTKQYMPMGIQCATTWVGFAILGIVFPGIFAETGWLIYMGFS